MYWIFVCELIDLSALIILLSLSADIMKGMVIYVWNCTSYTQYCPHITETDKTEE